MGGHSKCWLFANGDDNNKYWAFCKKYKDADEISFKAQVKQQSGYNCRTVHRKDSKPEEPKPNDTWRLIEIKV